MEKVKSAVMTAAIVVVVIAIAYRIPTLNSLVKAALTPPATA